MAEEQPQKPNARAAAAEVPGPTAEVAAPADPSIFSLEDLDKIIEAEDPDFKRGIDALKADKLQLSADHENLGLKTDDDHLTKDEHEGAGSRREIFQKLLFNPYRRARTLLRMQGIALFNRLQQFFSRTIEFLRHELPERFNYYRSRGTEILKAGRKLRAELKKMPRAQKVGLGFIFVASVAALFFLSKTFTGDWLPRYEDNMPRSLAGSGFVRNYQSKGELQDLFLAFPEVEYYVLLKKVVVNLRPSESSGANPMGTFEIYVGVDAQDTAIEVKDRERELVDLVQRTLEGFTYDDTTTVVGKSRMKEVLRDHINEILNQGRVFHVYFNTFVVYSGA